MLHVAKNGFGLSGSRGARVKIIAVLAVLPLFASCDDHDRDGCFNCGPYQPYEVLNGVVTGDFNGNSHTSVIAASTVIYQSRFNQGNLKAYLSSGAGTLAPPTLTAAGDDPLYLAGADLNGDGLPDVVSASVDDGTLTVFFNSVKDPGTFNAPLVLSSPGASQVAIGDVNGDGLADLVSADYNVSLFIQTAPGTFASGVSLYSGGANWVAIGDLNGDGSPDIALTDQYGVKVLMHTGTASSATFAAPVSVFNASVSGANLLAIADVNGDGLGDLIVTDPDAADGVPSVYILLQDPSHHGQFLTPVRYPTGSSSHARSIAVADLNADGHVDIIIGSRTDVSVLLQNAAVAGTYLAASNYSVAYVDEIAVADVNGDGLADIVVPTGPSNPVISGIITSNPGVLLQVAGTPGKFGSLTNLP